MTVLSSRWSLLWKWLGPGCAGVLGAGAGVVVLLDFLTKHSFQVFGALVMLVCAGFVFVKIRAIRTVIVDSVVYDSDRLKVKRDREEDAVLLTNIERVDDNTLGRPETITLRLKSPSRLGRRLVFHPPQSFNPCETHPIAAALAARVAEVQSEAAGFAEPPRISAH